MAKIRCKNENSLSVQANQISVLEDSIIRRTESNFDNIPGVISDEEFEYEVNY